jgi:hypothetical protein
MARDKEVVPSSNIAIFISIWKYSINPTLCLSVYALINAFHIVQISTLCGEKRAFLQTNFLPQINSYCNFSPLRPILIL